MGEERDRQRQEVKDTQDRKVQVGRRLTSFMLQMSPSVDPQALPGLAFQGIIPDGSKR